MRALLQVNVMTSGTLLAQPGALWARLTACTERALRSGALQPIATAYERVEQAGIPFILRMLANLVRKEQAAKERTRPPAGGACNPFLPYDPDLFVTEISATHLGLLNKFNVLDHHLLIVTRAFEEQDRLLNRHDFEALWACLHAIDGLGFYNGGRIAGASQRHKHLQLVPLPLAPQGPAIPIAAAFTGLDCNDSIDIAPLLPFRHAFVRFEPQRVQAPVEAAAVTLELYRRMLRAVGLLDCATMVAEDQRQTGPYNLLVTRTWMLLAPRSQECFDTVPVNALGFAGALLVRNEQQARVVKAQGPLTVLQQVALPCR